MAFRSHWRFTAEFCTPGEGHEKGGVEGEGGCFRRNHLVPVPAVADLDALNAFLLTGCREDEGRILDGRTEPVGAAMVAERDHLLGRASEGFDLADVSFPLVDKQGCVMVKTNAYSVPVRAGSRVEARAYPLHVEIWNSGHRIARHERCHQRRQHVLDLEHYLDDGQPHLMLTQFIATVPAKELRKPVLSLDARSDDIMRALKTHRHLACRST